MTDEKVHVYVEREVLFKRSLTVGIKIITPMEVDPEFVGNLLTEAIEAVQKWEPRKEWE